MAEKPSFHVVQDCGRDLVCDRAWMNHLQRHGGEPSLHLHHAQRDFGPVPVGGAQVLPFARSKSSGGAA